MSAPEPASICSDSPSLLRTRTPARRIGPPRHTIDNVRAAAVQAPRSLSLGPHRTGTPLLSPRPRHGPRPTTVAATCGPTARLRGGNRASRSSVERCEWMGGQGSVFEGSGARTPSRRVARALTRARSIGELNPAASSHAGGVAPATDHRDRATRKQPLEGLSIRPVHTRASEFDGRGR